MSPVTSAVKIFSRRSENTGRYRRIRSSGTNTKKGVSHDRWTLPPVSKANREDKMMGARATEKTKSRSNFGKPGSFPRGRKASAAKGRISRARYCHQAFRYMWYYLLAFFPFHYYSKLFYMCQIPNKLQALCLPYHLSLLAILQV